MESKKLGNGGTAEVYLGTDVLTGKHYAIKKYKKKEFCKNGKKEIELLQEIQHPGIPEVREILHERQRVCMVMEYVPGISLKERILKNGKIPEEQVVLWGIELCEILAYLHRYQVVYRDLKPGNIMITPLEHVKLIDFGTAVRIGALSGCSTEVDNVGTIGYAAPEQFEKNSCLDRRVDIYAMGATLYHMITGAYPAKAPEEFRSIRKCGYKISRDMEYIIMKCLQRTPNARYQFCEEIKKELEDVGIKGKKRMLYIKKTRLLC